MKKILFYYIVLYSTHLLGQVDPAGDTMGGATEDSIKIKIIEKNMIRWNSYKDYFNISIRQCYDTTSRKSCYCNDMKFYGTVEEAIKRVLAIHPDRIQFKGTVPNQKICFNDASNDSGVDFENLFFKTMREQLGMKKVYPKNQLCDFWIIEKTKQMNFPFYDDLRDGENTYARFDTQTNEYISTGGPLSTLAFSIAQITHKTVENRIEDDRETYNFKIPNAAFESFESLAKYLMDTYGVLLRKEKRLAVVTIIEF